MAKKNKSPYKQRLKAREVNNTTLRRVYQYSTTKYTRRHATQYVDGTQAYTYGTFREAVERLSQRMSRYGISCNDKVAVLSQNMPNYLVAFFSVTAFGRVLVPILPDSSTNEIDNILTHSETKAIFVSKKLLGKLSEQIKERLTLVIDIETFEFIKKNKEDFQCDGWVKEPAPDDLATIIYTSGTTGRAKGVMLSHRNICHNLVASYKAQPRGKRDRFLSILPIAHTYEMGVSSIYSFYCGACVYYLHKPAAVSVLLPALKNIRPTVMLSVPLVIEKVIKNSVFPTIRGSRVLTWMDHHTPHLLHRLIGGRLRRTFGGKMSFFGIGGAKLDPVVEKFLLDCRFPYAPGYGLTETSPLVCNVLMNKRKKVGSIGVPTYKVEVRLDNVDPETGEGEIVCRGDNVMLGYYKDPERTMSVLDDDGWFHTNDVAICDRDGYYFIKGRLNNTILGASGENIYPEEIEQVINNIDGVDESLVMERDGHLVALVKFNDNVLDWNQASEDQFFENMEARKKAVLEWVNKAVGKNSKIGEVDAMKEPFEKTATQKIRRFLYKNFRGDGSRKGAAGKTPEADKSRKNSGKDVE